MNYSFVGNNNNNAGNVNDSGSELSFNKSYQTGGNNKIELYNDSNGHQKAKYFRNGQLVHDDTRGQTTSGNVNSGNINSGNVMFGPGPGPSFGPGFSYSFVGNGNSQSGNVNKRSTGSYSSNNMVVDANGNYSFVGSNLSNVDNI